VGTSLREEQGGWAGALSVGEPKRLSAVRVCPLCRGARTRTASSLYWWTNLIYMFFKTYRPYSVFPSPEGASRIAREFSYDLRIRQ
jgi:hypothetical protein